MCYIKKEYRRLLEKSNQEFIIPTTFQKFVDKKAALHNLIIKSKAGNCICTNCQYHFISKVKVNKETKCPNCKQQLLVKTNRLQSYVFKDNLQLLDKVEDTFILRTFELYSSYNNYQTKHIITEFMRTILKDGEESDFVTNQVQNHMGYMYVAHYRPFTHWRVRSHRWAYRDVIGMVSPYNLKQLLSSVPELKYSQLDKFVSKMDYFDLIPYFKYKARCPSFELLVKLKLYNLAKDVSSLNIGKTFQEIMGVSKTFYPFMKKHNITYEELEALRIVKKENIRLIRNLTKFNNLKELSRYVNIEKAYKRVLRKHRNHEPEYLDYLRACVKLGYDMKDSKVLFPSHLMEAHDKVHRLLVMVENEANDRLIQERLTQLNHYIYQSKKYIVFPATSVNSLIDESKQQGHCVKNYCSRYALADCDIYFMRAIEHQEKSLVTIEVRENKIIQSRTKGNDDPTKEQMKFLNTWQQRILSPV